MNILLFASSLGVGLMFHLTRLSIALKKRGHGIVVLSGKDEQVKNLSCELENAGIECVKSEFLDHLSLRSVCETRRDIKRILMKEDVDVIHAQGTIHTLNANLATKSLETKPIITSIHYIPKQGLRHIPKWALQISILNSCADIVLPVSNDTKRALTKYGLRPEKAITIHNAIDLDFFDNSSNEPETYHVVEKRENHTILYAARLIPKKGHQYYLRAAVEVLKSHDATFYVIGDGPLRGYLERLSVDFGIRDNVVFTGRISGWSGLYHIMKNVCDICVSTSLKELFPFYVLECMASGKPVVTTNVGGVSEAVIDGVNGYVVPPKDYMAIARGIIELIENPKEQERMGVNGRKMVEKEFSIEATLPKLENIYRMYSS